MTPRSLFRPFVALVVFGSSLAFAAPAFAWGSCPEYVTVQFGDTLGGIAITCGTTMDAIRAANPGLGWYLNAGQVLYIPGGYTTSPTSNPGSYGGTYVVQWGDTMGAIAARYGVSLASLIAANPHIWNPSLIFPGQVLNLPSYSTSSYGGLILTYPYGNSTPVPYPGYYPTPYPTSYYATPVSSSPFGNLKVTYGHGLLVRTGPGIGYPEIKSQFVSAVKSSTWRYRKDSLTLDSTNFAWIEVQLSSLSGYSAGWILVRDSIGTYFTDPQLGPFIDPEDP